MAFAQPLRPSFDLEVTAMSTIPSSGAEQRRMPRKPPKPGTVVECRKGTLGLGADLAIAMLDISVDGVLMMIREPLSVGEEIEICVTALGFSRPRRLEATVVRCTKEEGVGYCMAAQFSTALNYVDIYHLT
jgi:hypothetical protein